MSEEQESAVPQKRTINPLFNLEGAPPVASKPSAGEKESRVVANPFTMGDSRPVDPPAVVDANTAGSLGEEWDVDDEVSEVFAESSVVEAPAVPDSGISEAGQEVVVGFTEDLDDVTEWTNVDPDSPQRVSAPSATAESPSQEFVPVDLIPETHQPVILPTEPPAEPATIPPFTNPLPSTPLPHQEAVKVSVEPVITAESDLIFEEEKRTYRNMPTKVSKKDKGRFHITDRDLTILRFLARYYYAHADTIARLVDTSRASIYARLRQLEKQGFIKQEKLAQGVTFWMPKYAGMELIGSAFAETSNVKWATVRHTVGLANIAAELERNSEDTRDILGLATELRQDFPVKERYRMGLRPPTGEPIAEEDKQWGLMTVSEREIRQGQVRWRGGKSTGEMRDLVDAAVLNPNAPELEAGYEGLFVVYGSGGKTGEHVPDMVVVRPRHPETGRPQHYAIELELNAKSPADWKRILKSYRDNGDMYDKVFYFTQEKGIRNMILNADTEVGLGERLIIRKYTPKDPAKPFLG